MLNVVNSFMSWSFKKRLNTLESNLLRSADIQMETFKLLLESMHKTSFGLEFNSTSIRSYDQYKQRIPIFEYDDLKPYIERAMHGEQKVLWPHEIRWFAKSSGTTSDKSKFIPVSFDTLSDCQFRGSRDTLAFYYRDNPNAKVFHGKGLIIGGSHQVNEFANNSYYGDLSAVMMNNLPFIAHYLATPSMDVALLDNWEEKLEMILKLCINEDVTNISGVPTWALLIIKGLLERSGKTDLKEVWPNLELYIHGGVNFDPYRAQFEKLISNTGVNGMNYRETYNASEGFFGVQDSEGEDMLLMTDYGIFYEFIPMEEIHRDHPHTLWLDEVELNKNYAVVLNSSSGLWRYILGDTVVFTSKNPYRIIVSGRTKLFINAFGEELMIDNAEKAISNTQKICDCIVSEYTAAPVYLDVDQKGGHEWMIEFEKEPADLDHFIITLDNELKKANSDYEAKRHGDLALVAPKVHVCKPGTFYNWMKSKNKLGGQNKVPRLSNNRKILDDILSFEAIV